MPFFKGLISYAMVVLEIALLMALVTQILSSLVGRSAYKDNHSEMEEVAWKIPSVEGCKCCN